MSLLRGLTKIALSPVVGVAQVAVDVFDGGNDGLDTAVAIASLGTVPMAKGTLKGVISGIGDILENY